MIKIPEHCEIKWIYKNSKYYKNKGYKFTKWGDKFKVKFEDLKSNDYSFPLKCKCDYCGKELIRYKGDLQKDKNDNIDLDSIIISCNNCKHKKVKDNLKNKYGVENVFQLKSVKEKSKETLINNYGVNNPSKAKEIKEKKKKTTLKNYGVENPFQSEKIKNKIKKKLKKRYGVIHPMKNKKIKEKAIKNSIKTLYKNESGPCSKYQKHLHNLLGGQLNYPISRCMLDIAFPEEKIYIEYNGKGHYVWYNIKKLSREQITKIEKNRKLFLKNKGWKLIRIISKNDTELQDNVIIKLISQAKKYLKNTEHTWVEIDIDQMEFKCIEYIKNINETEN